jgi:hypothetical protein
MTRGEGQAAAAEKFDWAAVAPSEHIAYFYEDDDALLDGLSAFVGEGLKAGDGAIVIATPIHLRALRQRLEGLEAYLIRAMFEDRYIALDANVALTSFMVNGVPDERLFSEMARSLLRRAGAHSHCVRGFGEMVALLWAQGNHDATVQLEQMWSRFCTNHAISLLCGYPQGLFPARPAGTVRRSLAEIRAAHTQTL